MCLEIPNTFKHFLAITRRRMQGFKTIQVRRESHTPQGRKTLNTVTASTLMVDQGYFVKLDIIII